MGSWEEFRIVEAVWVESLGNYFEKYRRFMNKRQIRHNFHDAVATANNQHAFKPQKIILSYWKKYCLYDQPQLYIFNRTIFEKNTVCMSNTEYMHYIYKFFVVKVIPIASKSVKNSLLFQLLSINALNHETLMRLHNYATPAQVFFSHFIFFYNR